MYKSKMFLIQALYRRVKENAGGEFGFMGTPGSTEFTLKKKKPEQPEQPTLTRPSSNQQAPQQQSSQQPDMRQYEHLGGATRGEPTAAEKFRNYRDKQRHEKERMGKEVQQTSEKFDRARGTEGETFRNKGKLRKIKGAGRAYDAEISRLEGELKANPKHPKAAEMRERILGLKKKAVRGRQLGETLKQKAADAGKKVAAETAEIKSSPGVQAAEKALNAPGGSTQPATKTTPALTTAPDGSKTPTVAPKLDAIKDWFKQPEVAKYAKPIAGLAGVAGLAYAGRAAWKAYKNRFDAAGRGRLQDMDQSQTVMASDRPFLTTEQAYRQLMERYY